ncbi:MAG: lytic transglycosylase [Bacteroidetes bacterium MedPE-SWsnd-G1]|nr:MAG: lytic transglycosylase [Bacteroidetes bacterium MedPE-SWsnd-G1]
MKLRIALIGCVLLFSSEIIAQKEADKTITDSLKTRFSELKENTVNDTIKNLQEANLAINDTVLPETNQLKNHKEITLIDSLWLQEMYSSPLYDTIQYVLTEELLEDVVLPELPTELLKERLAHLDSNTPFNVEYNASLERIIKSYLKNRRQTFAKLMARAQYYFPLFEAELDRYDIPMEMKYLAIVESALKPRAKSRVGATGLWQFMYQTGKQFKLDVSSYVDDRQDPLKATKAACEYLAALYKMFGDWDLALAAYNSGPGNVNKAIRRSGGSKNYWNMRNYLPRETAGYVPAFYATLYIFEYAEEHGLKPEKEVINLFETDTIHLKQQVTFEQLNKYLDVDIEMLQFLNPQYKLDIIPHVKGRDYYVRLPLYNIGQFASNEKELYAFVDEEEKKREQTLPQYIEQNDRIRYRVVSGDYLGKIANRYGVSVSSIKRWNGLRSNRLKVGQRLTIYPRKSGEMASTSTTKKSSTTSKPKGSFKTYTVQKGDSLWLISQKYSNVSVQNLKEWNDIWSAKSLKPGMKLKIY